jgi:diguanylate cyclase (GGDEF)-like protein
LVQTAIGRPARGVAMIPATPPSEAVVLVVDDDEANRQIVSTLLDHHGYRVHEASDGREGLQVALSVRPRLVISDILMPSMDGYEFVRQLRAHPELEKTEVVFYTANYHEREAQKLAQACRVARVLAKPCPPADILNALDQILQRGARAASPVRVGTEFDHEHLQVVTDKLAEKVNELQAANSRLKALTDLNLQLASERDPRVLVEKVCYGARCLLGAKYSVLVVDEMNDADRFFAAASGVAFTGSAVAPVPPPDDPGPLGRVYVGRDTWRGLHGVTEPPFRVLPAGYPPAAAYAAAPISSLTQTYGWLCLADKLGADEFTAEDERILGILAAQVGRIYENGLLTRRIQFHAEQLRADITERKQAEAKIKHLNRVYGLLSGINALVVRAPTQDVLFAEACRLAVQQGDFLLAWIGCMTTDQDRISPAAWAGQSSVVTELLRDGSSIPIEADACLSRAIQGQKPCVCNDLASEQEAVMNRREAIERGLRSMVVLPLVIHERTVGCLVLAAAMPGSFDPAEMQLLIELADNIAFALDHFEKAEKLNYLAYYDALTGLPNRVLFMDRLEQRIAAAKNSGARFAVIVADPERFETINDTFGRRHGDVLLKKVASRLLGCSSDPDMVARIAPGQFASTISFVGEVDRALKNFEEQYRGWLGSPFDLNGNELSVSARVGIALHPNDGADAESLLKSADAALKKAKSSDEKLVFFTQKISDWIAERLSMETRLRRALENREFVLHYQPKVDTETRDIEGVEALLRWESPELGLMPPSKFIPLMEETGMIVEVGSWVLRQASADRCSWLKQGLAAPRIAVNVSTVQLRRPDFVDVFRRAIDGADNTSSIADRDAGIDIEVTESLLVEGSEVNMEKLRALRDLGVGIAIDDFGTGYSSLGYLAKLPVQSLKIDRTFTMEMLDDPSVMTLVSTMITLAHSLKLKVIAEGVESEEQAKFLRLLRCDQMQGYLISRPLPLAAMAAKLGTAKKLRA